MACPTCGYEMQFVGEAAGDLHWCPRCGTMKTECSASVCVPKLVERCREFEADFIGPLDSGERLSNEWVRLGIAESINIPEARPPAP